MRLLAVVSVLVLLLTATARAEEVRLPKPILDDEDLSIHVVETSCNSYLITCKRTREFVVVDPGPSLGGTVTAWKRTGYTPKAIWITHEHHDHHGGLREVAGRLHVPIVAHAQAVAGMKRVASQDTTLPDTVVEDGAVLAVGKTRWKVLHLPGHAAGSLGFLLEGRVLVAGDVLFEGSVGRTDLPGSNPVAFAKALGTKVWPLADATLVLPGHGPTTTLGEEKKTNWRFQDLARKGRGEAPIPRPWVGVRFDTAHRGGGLRLAEVVDGSPARAAGLAAGDVLLACDGTPLRTLQDLFGVIRKHAVGDTVPITFTRDGAARSTSLTFRARPTD